MWLPVRLGWFDYMQFVLGIQVLLSNQPKEPQLLVLDQYGLIEPSFYLSGVPT